MQSLAIKLFCALLKCGPKVYTEKFQYTVHTQYTAHEIEI